MKGTVLSMLATVSRHGRAALIVGLLLFLVALRIGPSKARDGLSNMPATLDFVLVLLLVLPLGVIAVSAMFGMTHLDYVLAVVLVLAAPAVSGSPN